MSRRAPPGALEVVVVADTHLRAGIERLPRRLLDALASADVIVHAGDIVSAAALAGFRELGEVHAVLGNNDHELVDILPEELHLTLSGVKIAVLHDSGARDARAARMRRRFPDAQVVIFGHSHIPVNDEGLDGQLLFNPGSPTQRRSQPRPTFGRLSIEAGRVKACIEALDPPGG
jgi:uncharacterized protein